MPRNYIVAPGHEFNYPADSTSEAAIKRAGGRSKMTAEALKQLKFKTAREGEDCSDMPKDALKLYLERGWVLVGEPVKASDIESKPDQKDGE